MNDFYNSVMSHEKFYSLMYSPYLSKYSPLEEQIVEVKTSDICWAKDGSSFIWGYPGPDYNEYTPQTYGKGWAFTKEEIIQSWAMDAQQTAFCPECREYTEYVTVDPVHREITVYGITFTYVHQSAHCVKCGAEVYVPSINDANEEARGTAYRKAEQGVTSECQI